MSINRGISDTNLTPLQEYFLELLDDRKPHETINITKNAEGSPATFRIIRSQQFSVSETEIRTIPVKI